jgi:hypothetical protein
VQLVALARWLELVGGGDRRAATAAVATSALILWVTRPRAAALCGRM